jgi:hypothetical protein
MEEKSGKKAYAEVREDAEFTEKRKREENPREIHRSADSALNDGGPLEAVMEQQTLQRESGDACREACKGGGMEVGCGQVEGSATPGSGRLRPRLSSGGLP